MSFTPVLAAFFSVLTAGLVSLSVFIYHNIRWQAKVATDGLKVRLSDGDKASLEAGTQASVAALSILNTIATENSALPPEIAKLNAHMERLNGSLAPLLAGQVLTDAERSAKIAEAVVIAAAKVETDRLKAVAQLVSEAEERGRLKALQELKSQSP